MTIDVEYWTDPLCIWAFLAQDKLDPLLAAHGDRLRLVARVVPVFGSIPERFASGSWADAGPEGRARATAEIAARFGHDEVSGEGWVSATPSSSWSAGAAAEAVRLAEQDDQVRPGATLDFLQALRTVFFVHDQDPTRRAVQQEVAEGCGIPWDEVVPALEDGRALAALWESHAQRQKLGIQGSPTWVFDGGHAVLYGNVGEGVLTATVQALLAGDRAGSSKC